MGSSAQRMKADNKRAGKKGSLPKDQQFVQLINAFRAEPAWLALSFGARCLYVELKALYNGNNNGRIMCSARFAALALGCSKNNLTGYFRDLQDKGFIVETKGGSLGSEGRGHGRLWRLTELGFMGDRPTKNYRDWKPAKNKSLSQVLGRSVPSSGTVAAEGVPSSGTGCPKGWDGNGVKPPKSVPSSGTMYYTRGKGKAAAAPDSVCNKPPKAAKPSPKSSESKNCGEFVGTTRRFTTTTTTKPKRTGIVLN